MGYHYIAVVRGDAAAAADPLSHTQLAFLRAQGMQSVAMPGPSLLFVSTETPTLLVPGGVIIGHIFSRSGAPLDASAFPGPRDSNALPGHLLTQCWGEYLLIQNAPRPGTGLTALREPSGGVPCFFFSKNGTAFITSDIGLAVGLGLYRREVDWAFIAWSLAYPHVNTECTALTGVRELLPGARLTLNCQYAVIDQAWSPWPFVAEPQRHRDHVSATEEIRSTVQTVVETWARTDKVVLMELSGGLDSSIIATCLANAKASVTCGTLVTPVPGADERRYAQPVADALGAALHATTLDIESVEFDFALPVQTARPRVSVLQQTANQAMTSTAQACGATSFFSGGGGDTVFGYSSGPAPAADALKERGVRAGAAAVHDLSMLHDCTYWKAGRLTLRKLVRGAKSPCNANVSFLDSSIASPPPAHHPWFTAPQNVLPGDQERIAELAGTQVFRDGAPRGAMHWLRLPLLSQPVVEACLKAPTWMWIAGGTNRALARDAFAHQLPPAVLARRSKGTFVSYSGAVYQRRKQAMRAFLMEGHLRRQRLLDIDALDTFFGATPHPRDTGFMRIFDLVMVENWLRQQD